MKIKIFFGILCTFCVLSTQAQDSLKTKSLGLGLSTSYAFETPDIAYTPNVFFQWNKHQVFVGLDVYYSHFTMYGFQGGYKFYMLPQNKIFNYFLAANFQYVQYGTGVAYVVPYNYLPTDMDKIDFNSIQVKSFSNTYGIGGNINFLYRFTFFTELSAGYNFANNQFSPTNTNEIFSSSVGNKFTFTPFLKIGLLAKMYKW